MRAHGRQVGMQAQQIEQVVKRVLAEQRRGEGHKDKEDRGDDWKFVVYLFEWVKATRRWEAIAARLRVVAGMYAVFGRGCLQQVMSVAQVGEEMWEVRREVAVGEMAVQTEGESKRRRKKRVKGVWLRVLVQVQMRRSGDWQQAIVTSVHVCGSEVF